MKNICSFRSCARGQGWTFNNLNWLVHINCYVDILVVHRNECKGLTCKRNFFIWSYLECSLFYQYLYKQLDTEKVDAVILYIFSYIRTFIYTSYCYLYAVVRDCVLVISEEYPLNLIPDSTFYWHTRSRYHILLTHSFQLSHSTDTLIPDISFYWHTHSRYLILLTHSFQLSHSTDTLIPDILLCWQSIIFALSLVNLALFSNSIFCNWGRS